MIRTLRMLAMVVGLLGVAPAFAAAPDDLAASVARIEPKVIAWRRDMHQHAELGNRETRTAAIVAKELRRLGFEVRTGIAYTGVVGILRGARPGRTIALRSELDALPIEEKTGLPFASKATIKIGGETYPLMHACGHDAHIAMLLGAANILAGMRDQLAGTVMFVFQPAEEAAPPGEEGGAFLMMKQGVFADPKPDAVFAIHMNDNDVGTFEYRVGSFLASSDEIHIKLTGRQTHGAQPWDGIDVIAMAADVIQGVNQIAARQTDLSFAPVVITIATLKAGTATNIIPETLEMTGTLRTFDKGQRDLAVQKLTARVKAIAGGYGGQADIAFTYPTPPTVNNAALSALLKPALARSAAGGRVVDDTPWNTGAEDFPFFTQGIPGLYVGLGARAKGTKRGESAPAHSPTFVLDEDAMRVGVATHVEVVRTFLGAGR